MSNQMRSVRVDVCCPNEAENKKLDKIIKKFGAIVLSQEYYPDDYTLEVETYVHKKDVNRYLNQIDKAGFIGCQPLHEINM